MEGYLDGIQVWINCRAEWCMRSCTCALLALVKSHSEVRDYDSPVIFAASHREPMRRRVVSKDLGWFNHSMCETGRPLIRHSGIQLQRVITSDWQQFLTFWILLICGRVWGGCTECGGCPIGASVISVGSPDNEIVYREHGTEVCSNPLLHVVVKLRSFIHLVAMSILE